MRNEKFIVELTIAEHKLFIEFARTKSAFSQVAVIRRNEQHP